MAIERKPWSPIGHHPSVLIRRRLIGLEINCLPGGASMNPAQPTDTWELLYGKIPVIWIRNTGVLDPEVVSSRISVGILPRFPSPGPIPQIVRSHAGIF